MHFCVLFQLHLGLKQAWKTVWYASVQRGFHLGAMQVRFELSAPMHFGDIWKELEKTKKMILI
jgi:hypothetical protein